MHSPYKSVDWPDCSQKLSDLSGIVFTMYCRIFHCFSHGKRGQVFQHLAILCDTALRPETQLGVV